MSLANLNSALQALGYTSGGVSSGDSSTWSTYPATQDVNLANHNINNVNDLNIVNNSDPEDVHSVQISLSAGNELGFGSSNSVAFHTNTLFIVGTDTNQSKVTIQNDSIIMGRDPTATLSINSTGNLATNAEVTKDSDENSLATLKYVSGLTGSDLSIWATFPASQDVDMANHALNNVTTINTSGLASLNGGGTVPNIASGDNSTNIANTAFVTNAVAGVSGGSSDNWSTVLPTQNVNMTNAGNKYGIQNSNDINCVSLSTGLNAGDEHAININTETGGKILTIQGDSTDNRIIFYQPGVPGNFTSLSCKTGYDLTTTSALLSPNTPSYIMCCNLTIGAVSYTEANNGTGNLTIAIVFPNFGGSYICSTSPTYISASTMCVGLTGSFICSPFVLQDNIAQIHAQITILPGCTLVSGSLYKIIFTCYGGVFKYNSTYNGLTTFDLTI